MKCDECNGSGKYVGLTTVEPCRACNGGGHVFVAGASTIRGVFIRADADSPKGTLLPHQAAMLDQLLRLADDAPLMRIQPRLGKVWPAEYQLE